MLARVSTYSFLVVASFVLVTSGCQLPALDGATEVSSELGTFQQALSPVDAAGEQRVLVVLGNFIGTDFDAPSPAFLDEMFFGDGSGEGRSLDDYYREVSYGQTWFSGLVWPEWVDLGIEPTCSTPAWRNAAVAAIDEQVDFTQYDHLVLLAPAGSCFANAFTSGGQIVSTQEGDRRMGVVYFDLARPIDFAAFLDKIHTVMVHEFGHVFGVEHSGALLCQPYAYMTDGCASFEWTDQLSPMGMPYPRWPTHFNVQQKVLIGWLGMDEVPLVMDSGVYEIQPLECGTNALPGCPQSNLPLGLRIRRGPGDEHATMFLEYRQELGYDVDLNPFLNGTGHSFESNMNLGPQVHLDDGLASVLLDASVSDTIGPDWHEGALEPALDPSAPLPHEEFFDAETGIRFVVLEASPDRAVVDIQLGLDVVGPLLSIDAPAPGTELVGDVPILVSAVDESGVARVELRAETNQGLVVFIQQLAAPPWESVWTVRPKDGCGHVRLYAEATDGAGNTTTASVGGHIPCPDTDGDGLADDQDNCPLTSNPNQANYDGDEFGDACDVCVASFLNDLDGDLICGFLLGDFDSNFCVDEADLDSLRILWSMAHPYADLNGDGLVNLSDLVIFAQNYDTCGDNCIFTHNPEQIDLDGNGFGDVCEPDDPAWVVLTVPPDGATGVSRTESLEIRYSVPIWDATASVTAEPPADLNAYGDYYEPLLVIEPLAPLDPSTTYTVTVAPGLQTLYFGVPTTEPFSFSFTTAAEPWRTAGKPIAKSP